MCLSARQAAPFVSADLGAYHDRVDKHKAPAPLLIHPLSLQETGTRIPGLVWQNSLQSYVTLHTLLKILNKQGVVAGLYEQAAFGVVEQGAGVAF